MKKVLELINEGLKKSFFNEDSKENFREQLATVQYQNLIKGLNLMSGNNAKKEQLNLALCHSEIVSNPAPLKALIRLALSPYITFGIKSIKQPKTYNKESKNDHIHNFIPLCKRLYERTLTGNEAKQHIEDFLSICNKDEQEMYINILKKKFVTGVAAKMVNAVVPNLVPEYGCQLATALDYKNLDLKNLNYDTVAFQPKIDGFRCQAFLYKDRVELYTRSGKRIEGYTGIENDLLTLIKKHPVYQDCVLDGEITNKATLDWIKNNIEKGIDASKDASRAEFQNTMKFAMAKTTDKDGVLNVFDMVYMNDWVEQKETEGFKSRNYGLEELGFKAFADTAEYLNLVDTYFMLFHTKSDQRKLECIKDYLDTFTAEGWEGLIIRPADAKYDWKRSKSLFKLKKFKDIDLEVIGVNEGTGKYKGTLGAVVVNFDGFEVGVGSGFTDEQRKQYWNNPNEIIGKTIEIRYQSVTTDQNGNKSLSFPVFQCVRFDK